MDKVETFIYETYSYDVDMTFILEDVKVNDDLVSTEIKGFYFGRPSFEATQESYGKLKAEFGR